MLAVPTSAVAAASLVAGYGVAVATDVRPLGGAVLLAGTAWCARVWTRRRGPGVAVGLVVVQAAAFAASHVLAGPLGAWPAVLAVAALSGTTAGLVADRGDRAHAVAGSGRLR